MATIKKGQLTASPEWAKHLREWKRDFWRGERRAEDRLARAEAEAFDTAEAPAESEAEQDKAD